MIILGELNSFILPYRQPYSVYPHTEFNSGLLVIILESFCLYLCYYIFIFFVRCKHYFTHTQIGDRYGVNNIHTIRRQGSVTFSINVPQNSRTGSHFRFSLHISYFSQFRSDLPQYKKKFLLKADSRKS